MKMIINNRQYDIKRIVHYENKEYCVYNITTSARGLKAFCFVIEDGTWKWIYKADNRELWRLVENGI